MRREPVRYRQADRHRIESIDLRQVALSTVQGQSAAAIGQLDTEIDRLRDMLANWPASKAAA